MSIPHPFELSGQGPAPYEFKGVTVKQNHCHHCGTAIKYNFHFIASNGHAFIVGSDCVLKAKGTTEYGIALQWKREHTRELAKARKLAQAEERRLAAFSTYPDLAELLAVEHYITKDIAKRFKAYGYLSTRQVDLLRKLKGEAEAKVAAPVVTKPTITVPGIVALFQKASGKLKRPSLTWNTPKGVIKIQMAGERSRRPGDFYVTDGGSYGSSTFYGWIEAASGAFEDRKSPEWVTEFLVEFEAAPVAKATEYGHASGNCCFCATKLTNEGSVSHGYGPVCAKNWGLPWKAKV